MSSPMSTDASSPSLSSLPLDLLSNVLARVPKSCYPILSRVSRKFRDVVRSRDIHIVRRKLGKDSLYICFTGQTNSRFGWFTLRRNETNPTENLFTPTDFPSIHGSILKPIAIGPEIFVIGNGTGVQIYDSRYEVLSEAPTMPRAYQVYFTFDGVGSIGNKVYVFGARTTDRDIEKIVELFDTNIREWQSAPDVQDNRFMMNPFFHTKEINKKICVLRSSGVTSYHPEDGSCDSSIHMPRKWKSGACVIDNILFAYVSDLGGLMWYDSPLNQWKVVNDGLNLNLNGKPVEMGEYYGKLALLWMESDEIWCTFIALERSASGFSGTAEPNKQLAILPCGAKLTHCLSVLV